MQSVVLDGVRRSVKSGDRPRALVLGTPRKRPAPLSQNVGAGRVGMDGVRRTAPSPREMFRPAEAVHAAIPQVLPPQASNRPAIAFGIVASAILVAGITGSHLITAHAADDSSARTQAVAHIGSAKSATPDNTAKATAATLATKNASLQSILDNFVAAHGSQYTIYVKDLKTGTIASVNADRVMLSASLYKLFVAQRIYQLVDTGKLSYGQDAGSESGRNIDGCLTVMINISDNACGHDLGTIVGWSKQDSALKNAGYSGTTLGSGDDPQLTNAKDVGLLLEHLYNGTLMSPNASDRFIGLLKQQRVNDRLPTGLPGGTVIAHKTGDLNGYTHDAGIIYGSKTDFEVVVMSGPWTSPENSKPAFGILAGQLNSYFNQ